MLRMTRAAEVDAARACCSRSATSLLALNFEWGVAVQDLKLGRFFKGRMKMPEFRERMRPFLRKAGRQLFKDYVLFPALAFWQWPRVLLGNLAANLIRNVWTNAIIFCGHFTEQVQTYTRREVAHETRGQWYLRQIQGSSNLEGGRWFHVMTGHLSHQIEHHLFPDLPAPRYAEIAPRVREICARYGDPLQHRRVLEAVRGRAGADRAVCVSDAAPGGDRRGLKDCVAPGTGWDCSAHPCASPLRRCAPAGPPAASGFAPGESVERGWGYGAHPLRHMRRKGRASQSGPLLRLCGGEGGIRTHVTAKP